MHKTNCMQSVEQISTWLVFSSIVLKGQSQEELSKKKKDKDKEDLFNVSYLKQTT